MPFFSVVRKPDILNPPPSSEIVANCLAGEAAAVRGEIASLRSLGTDDKAVAIALARPLAFTAQALEIVSSLHTIPDPPALSPVVEAMIKRFGPIPTLSSTLLHKSHIWRIPSTTVVAFLDHAHQEKDISKAAMATLAGLPRQPAKPDSTMALAIERYLRLENPRTGALVVQQVLHSVGPNAGLARLILAHLFWSEILDFVAARPSEEHDLILVILDERRNSTRLKWARWENVRAFLNQGSGAIEADLSSPAVGIETHATRAEAEARYRCVADRALLLASLRGLPSLDVESSDLIHYLLERSQTSIVQTQDAFFPSTLGYVDRTCLAKLHRALIEVSLGRMDKEAIRRIAGADPADQEVEWDDVKRDYAEFGKELGALVEVVTLNEGLELAIGDCAVPSYHTAFVRRDGSKVGV